MQYPADGVLLLNLIVAGGAVGGVDGYGSGIAGVHRQRLKANRLKPWQLKMWCVGEMDAAYIAQMEHILDVYAEPSCPERPLVNVDEAGKQLVGEVQAGKPMAPGQEQSGL